MRMCEIIIDGKTVELEGSVLDQEALKSYRETAMEIKICDSFTEIGMFAFFAFENLKSIEIPNSVIIIERDAFNSCYALENIVIPDSVTKIGDGAFWECTSLKSISLPDAIEIGSEAFFRNNNSDNIRIKLRKANSTLQNVSLVGDTGQIITVDNDGNDYSVLTYRNTYGYTMIVTGHVDYAGGKLYSGYEFLGDLEPSKTESMYCYISEGNVYYDTTLSGLKRQLEDFDIC